MAVAVEQSTTPNSSDGPATPAPPALTSRVAQALSKWQSELLDLSKANRLLYFRPGSGALALSDPEPESLFDGLVNGERSFVFRRLEEDDSEAATTERQVAEQLSLVLADDTAEESPLGEAASATTPEATSSGNGTAAARAKRPLRANEVVAVGEAKKVEASLYRLRLRSRSALQEQGVTVLYAAFGMLDWTESPTSSVRIQSPLVLVPVKLERDTALEPYKLEPLDEEITLNPALVFKLKRDFDLTIDLPDTGDEDLTLRAALEHIRTAVAGRRDWHVREEAHVGLFSFAKHAMYTDLVANQARFAGHSVVRLLSGEDDGLPPPVPGLLSADQLDDAVQPADTFQVRDADASQQEAIEAVKAGASLVIQGPPGTGKSQTITNIIAECLAQGKTVLFVSEKMAALNVVAKRLAEARLREFCLEAHTQGSDKAAVVRDLANTLNAGRQSRIPHARAVNLDRLADLRTQLNAYVRALHDSNNALGRSAFEVHREIAARQQAPIITFPIPDVGSLTPKRLTSLELLVEQLVHTSGVLLEGDAHPWRGCTISAVTPQVQAELQQQLTRLANTASHLASSESMLRNQWSLPAGGTRQSAIWLQELLALLGQRVSAPDHWFSSPSLGPLTELANDYRRRMDDFHLRQRALFANYSPAVFNLNLASIAEHLQAGGQPVSNRILGQGEPADRALTRQSEIIAAVERIAAALTQIQQAAVTVAGRLGLDQPRTIAEARTVHAIAGLVLANPRPMRHWCQPGRRAALAELAAEAGQQQEVVRATDSALRETFDDEFFEHVTTERVARFEEAYGSWLRVFKPGYHREFGLLKRTLKAKQPFGYPQALDSLKQARRLAKAREWLEQRRETLTTEFGDHYAGSATDWTAVSASLESVAQIASHLDGREFPTTLVDVLTGASGGVTALRPHASALSAAATELDGALEDIYRVLSLQNLPFGGLQPEDVPIDDLLPWLTSVPTSLAPLWTAAESLQKCRLTGGSVPTVAMLLTEAREAATLREICAELDTAAQSLRAQFGELFDGLHTDWDTILQALGWVGRIVGHFGGPPPESFVRPLSDDTAIDEPTQAALIASSRELGQILDTVQTHFTAEIFIPEDPSWHRVPFADMEHWARTRLASFWRLEEWVDYTRAVAAAREANLEEFVEGLRREQPAPNTWKDAFFRQLYTLWITWRYDNCSELAQFRGQRQASLIEEFHRLDKAQWQVAAAARIAERLIKKRPVVSLNQHPKSEPAILQREANKKRRFRPLRKLFADLPHLLPELKPCLLMSPLAVAQFLGESAITFDIVIFDEASQILPADAIGAIARSRQVIVVGDQKQLPPTSFFAATAQITDDDSDEEPPESILDACSAAGMPTKPLLWHYRSRHEHLIAFSNRCIYERRLITFPSPNEAERAVEFVHVPDGVYDRASSRVNRVEARRIADLVIEHVRENPKQSLGVITFSEAQMVAIQTELDARKRANPDLEVALKEDGAEGFFVKNLENVQGDERDVIFFSVGYGPDQAGKMTMNFGPLNRQGGERRLNVAVTRARDRVKILASFRYYDLNLSQTSAKGVQLLKQYLEFAEKGPIALLGEITSEGGDFDSPFEELVADALTARDLRVVSQVGVGSFRIDLGIKDEHSERYLLGIECDGATYHSSKTARDRDRLRQEVLETLGWRIHRIWSTDWIKDPQREVEKVLLAYEEARAGRRPESPVEVVSEDDLTTQISITPETNGLLSIDPEPSPPAPTAVVHAPIAIPYLPVTLPLAGDLEDFRNASTHQFAAAVYRCVENEGPVHQDRVMRAVAASYGIQRVGSNVRARLEASILQAVRSRRVVQKGAILWPAVLTALTVRGADADGRARPIQEVPPEEISAGVIAYLRNAFSIPEEDLVTAVARELGYDRTGTHVATAIGDSVRALIAAGTIDNVGGLLRLSAN